MPEPIRVLVVEDDAVYQHLLEAWLESGSEFHTVAAGSLHAARGQLEAAKFDAVLLDLNLGDSSGLDTLETLQGLAPSTPIVILTGMEDDAQGVVAVGAGAQEYLTKSGLGPDELRQELRIAVARATAEQERMGALGQDLEKRLRAQLDTEKERFYQAAARNLRGPLELLSEDVDRIRAELHGHLSIDQQHVLGEMHDHINALAAIADDLAQVAGLEPARRPAAEDPYGST